MSNCETEGHLEESGVFVTTQVQASPECTIWGLGAKLNIRVDNYCARAVEIYMGNSRRTCSP